MDDCYQILNVPPTATQEEISRRYRFLAKAYHPDRFSTDEERQAANEDMKRINTAYNVLKDPILREKYDREHGYAPRKPAAQAGKDPETGRPYADANSAALSYLYGLLEKWERLIKVHKEDRDQSVLLERVRSELLELYLYTDPFATKDQVEKLAARFAPLVGIMSMLSIALGAEDQSQGLPAALQKTALLELAREPLLQQVKALYKEALRTKSHAYDDINRHHAILTQSAERLQELYVSAGRELYQRANPNEQREATSSWNSDDPWQSAESSTVHSSPGEQNEEYGFGYCSSCGRLTQVKHLSFNRNTGFFIMRRHLKVEGLLCADCVENYFWSFTGHNMLFGWLGPLSIIVNPIYILKNIGNYFSGWSLRKYSTGLGSIAAGWKAVTVFIIVGVAIAFGLSNPGIIEASTLGLQGSSQAPARSPSSSTRTPSAMSGNVARTATPQVGIQNAGAGLPTSCLLWKDVTRDDVGERLCVYGDMRTWYWIDDSFQMVFSEGKNSVRFITEDNWYFDVEDGDCISTEGIVELKNNRLVIVTEDVYICSEKSTSTSARTTNKNTRQTQQASNSSSASSRVSAMYSNNSDCTLWSEVTAADKGKTLCVYGNLKKAYGGDGLFYMTFSDNEHAFRFISTGGWYFEVGPGDCLKGEGKVEVYNHMPYITAQDLYDCGS